MTHESDIVIICAYCPEVRSRTLAVKAAGKTASHGICPTCAAKMNQQMDEMEKEQMKNVQDAVIVDVYGSGTYVSINVHVIQNQRSVQHAVFAGWQHALASLDTVLMLAPCPVFICENALDAFDRIRLYAIRDAQ